VPLMTRSWERRARNESPFVHDEPCPECGGARLRAESLAVKVEGKGIRELCDLPLRAALEFFEALPPADAVAAPLVREIARRLALLLELGLDYLTLGRDVTSLSAGEYQRVRLAMQIGANLTGIMYVLDEPTVGLHPSETERLIAIFARLCAQGSTVLLVEHDLDVIRAADYVLDLGPGSGPEGGTLVAEGTPEEIAASAASLTGRYLAGKERFEKVRRRSTKARIEVRGASGHNLKGIDVSFPLRALSCVTGPSGSGKSTLVIDTLFRGLRASLQGGALLADTRAEIEVGGELARVVAVDQSPVGRSARSNPATYAGFFGPIRELFAKLPLSRVRGYGADRFSFNVKGGRCEHCEGDGVTRVHMQFLPDIVVPCEVCGGKRFNAETLEVRYRGLSIAEVLACSVSAANELFSELPKVAEGLHFLEEIGLGYLTLGQRADTLSGGEAQRLKLSRELAHVARDTLYVLDEPTTGLHLADIRLLLKALWRLVAEGNTVIVIEHNVEFIAACDHVVDLGPGGGGAGGNVVAAGTPEEVAAHKASVTGKYLRRVLEGRSRAH
jgi:excinuclease ABC subunit A